MNDVIKNPRNSDVKASTIEKQGCRGRQWEDHMYLWHSLTVVVPRQNDLSFSVIFVQYFSHNVRLFFFFNYIHPAALCRLRNFHEKHPLSGLCLWGVGQLYRGKCYTTVLWAEFLQAIELTKVCKRHLQLFNIVWSAWPSQRFSAYIYLSTYKYTALGQNM